MDLISVSYTHLAAEAAAAAAAQEAAAASGGGESSGGGYVEDVSNAYKPSYGGGWVWPSDTTCLLYTSKSQLSESELKGGRAS